MIRVEGKASIREKHLELARSRGRDKTYCPSEVARALFTDDWRVKMDQVRQIADRLVELGLIEVYQKNQLVHEKPTKVVGPFRLKISK